MRFREMCRGGVRSVLREERSLLQGGPVYTYSLLPPRLRPTARMPFPAFRGLVYTAY